MCESADEGLMGVGGRNGPRAFMSILHFSLGVFSWGFLAFWISSRASDGVFLFFVFFFFWASHPSAAKTAAFHWKHHEKNQASRQKRVFFLILFYCFFLSSQQKKRRSETLGTGFAHVRLTVGQRKDGMGWGDLGQPGRDFFLISGYGSSGMACWMEVDSD